MKKRFVHGWFIATLLTMGLLMGCSTTQANVIILEDEAATENGVCTEATNDVTDAPLDAWGEQND